MTARAGEDRELIDRFLTGDGSAFETLMRAHEDRVFAVCLRIMGNRETALDATQETFLTVFRKADRFTGGSAFSTWLYRVAVNTCYDQLRKLKRRTAEPIPDHLDPADPAGSSRFESVDVRGEIEEALAALPEEFRAVVVLSDLEDLALADIAAALDLPVGTVKSRVFRGRRMLADSLRNLREGPGRQTDERHA